MRDYSPELRETPDFRRDMPPMTPESRGARARAGKPRVAVKRMVLPPVMVMFATVAVFGQEFEGRPDEARGPRGRGRGPSVRRIIERLDQRIEFDEAQIAQIDELVAAHEERMQELRAQWQEVRAAMEAGDEARAAELREKLRRQRGGPGEIIRTVFDEIEPLLHESQLEAFQEFRGNFARRRDHGEIGRMRQMIRELPDAVNMTEDQRREFQEFLTDRRQAMRAQMRERWPQGGGGGFGERGRWGPPDFAAMREEIFAGVAEILNEDQLELLTVYWGPTESGLHPGEEAGPEDFRVVLLAAKRVRDLNDAQKQAWRQIMLDAMRSFRRLRRTDKEGKAELDAEVKGRILELLDQTQKEAFERNMERLEKRQKRAPRGRGAPRPPDDPQPNPDSP